jgi:anaerobic magnesium-protoporphyrin IX monomethyl ester cyclase
MYEKSIAIGLPGMEKHIRFLEQLEQPFYNNNDTLREELLKEQFEEKYGPLREWLKKTQRADVNFAKEYAR